MDKSKQKLCIHRSKCQENNEYGLLFLFQKIQQKKKRINKQEAYKYPKIFSLAF